MAQESVETAVYRLRVEGQDQIDRLTKSIGDLAVAEETATKTTRTTSDELQKRIARYDPLLRAQQAYSKELQNIAKYQETGVGTQKEINALFEGATARYQATTKATQQLGEAHTALSSQSQAAFHSVRSFFEQIALGQSPITAAIGQINHLTYAATGEGGVVGAFKALASGAVTFAMSLPGLLTIVGAVAAGFGLLAIKASDARKQTELALSGPGAASGMQPADITNFAQQNATITGLSRAQAKEIAEEWAHTGNIAVNELTGVGEAVVGFSVKTKTSFTEAGSALGKLFAADDLTKAVDALSGEYPELNANIRASVDALQQQGEKAKATQLIMDAMAESNRKAAENMSGLAKISNALGNVLQLRPFEESAKRLEDQIAAIEDKVSKLEDKPVKGGTALMIQDLTEKWAKLNEELRKTTEAAEKTKLDMIGNEAQKMARDLDPTIQKLTETRLAIQRVQEAQASGAPGAKTPAVDDLLIKLQNYEKLLTDSQAKTRALNQYTADLAAKWGNVTIETAKALEQLNNQLPVIEAIGGAAKLAAQEQARINELVSQQVPLEEAVTRAAAERRNAQAAVDAQSKEKVAQIQNETQAIQRQTEYIKEQIAIGSQMTGTQAAKMGAQQRELEDQAKINELVRQNVSLEQATAQVTAERAMSAANLQLEIAQRIQKADQEIEMAKAITHYDEQRVAFRRTYNDLLARGATAQEAEVVATKEFLADQEKVNKSIYQQVKALNQSTDLLNAQQDGTEAVVKAAQAYSNAIDAGASATAAAALETATLVNELTKADIAAQKLADSELKAALAAAKGNIWAPSNLDRWGVQNQPTGSSLPLIRTVSGWAVPTDFRQIALANSPQVQAGWAAMDNPQTTQSTTQMNDAEAKRMIELMFTGMSPQLAASTAHAEALKNSVDNLTKSTDSLNATNQELLSPYYTQDPRTSHIGFRSQGMAAGGYVDVPGGVSTNDNMIATIPVASGERIYIDPMNNRRSTSSGSGMVINISSPITINGNANADQFGRTVFQANQQLAKSVRAATQ